MSDPLSFVITTQKPKLLQEMLKESGVLGYFESTVKENQLHMSGRTNGPLGKYDNLESTFKKFSNVTPVVVCYFAGCVGESQQIHAYTKGKSIFSEDFSYTPKQFEEFMMSAK